MVWDINLLLTKALDLKASDLHLAVTYPPMLRIRGELKPIAGLSSLTPSDIEEILCILIDDEARQSFYRNKELDFSYSLPGLARFRVNASFQRGSVSLSLRPVTVTIPSLEQLGLPEVCKELAVRPHGLVLVTGPTGSGKSTTLAAMIDYLNQKTSQRIITIEDPIEFFHQSQRSMIIQRELGSDTLSFASALRYVLRQDPDIILIGELRDLETIAIALTAAETGHLVLSTVHSSGAIRAVERIIDIFPAERQSMVRYQLSMVLEGIIFQLLLPRADGQGRVAAVEVLVGTTAVHNLIRQNELNQIKTYLHSGAEYGMQTIEQSLASLVKGGVITAADAMSRASDPENLEILLGLREQH
ncbi:MAG: type IV pilus twitching motility protein PilT [Chloroflexi bacterium]|nr:type IV pilus twitching motility protein PilT [Chloroflexota bacterium]